MALPKNVDPYLKRLKEIENNVRSFMTLQFEHNNFFRNELKEQKSFMEYMNKTARVKWGRGKREANGK